MAKAQLIDFSPYSEVLPKAIKAFKTSGTDEVQEQLCELGLSTERSKELAQVANHFLKAAVLLDLPQYTSFVCTDKMLSLELVTVQELYPFSDEEIEVYLKLSLDEINKWSAKRKTEFADTLRTWKVS